MTAGVATAMDQAAAERDHRNRWYVLAVIATAQLMVMLDGTIVQIALPSVQKSLHMSDANRQWMVTAYALAFGGLLLVGGRLADRFGRGRTFLVGLVGFAVVSAIGGAAPNTETLIAARALQGVFAAILSPATVSLLTTTFTDTKERAKAFGLFSGIVGSGAAIGLIIGGVLTEYAGWRWCLYVNVPIAAAVTALGIATLPRNRGHRDISLDAVGAVLGCLGPVALVYGLSEAPERGWGSPLVIGLLATSVVLIGAFLVSQVLIRQPLLPLRVVAERTRSGSFLGAALLNFGMMGISLFATYHLQMVMHYKPLKAGFAFLPMVGAVMVTATQVVARVMGRIPTRWLVGPGLAFTAAGVWMFTTLSEDSSYLFGVLPAWLLLGVGMGLSYSPTAHASLAGVAERDSGAVSAFQTTARQIGGAIGLALSNTLAASAAASYYADHKGQGAQDGLLTKSLVHGTAAAAWWVSGILLIGTIICTIMINADPRKPRQATADVEAAPDTDTDTDTVMIRGHVVWSEDVPVSEAALTLVSHDGREVARTSADRDGAYTLRAPGHGPYLLIARSDTHRSTAMPLAATAGASAIEHTVTFQDEGAVTGIARDEADGAPLKGTSVILTDVNGRLIRSLSTDEDGSFLIDKLAYSPYVLVLHQDGYRPRAIDLQVSEAQLITVTAELASHARLGSLSGVVSDSEHTCVNDVRLTLTDGSGTRLTATSKEDGSFRFADVPVGNYILIAAGHPPTVSRLEISEATNQHNIHLDSRGEAASHES
ncbi:DHA2 family efflux MFS transporter permease subunit [Streptomyces sp. NPDC058357]|uniref:MFS transporter n=1 Tax=unclassified Streptomyces TaxID=2593676 RepID=UPI00365D9F43